MSATSRHDNQATAAALAAFYAGATTDGDAYLERKRAAGAASQELAHAWSKVRFALDGATTVLDWGCRDGVFGWLARHELGDGLGLWGCDVVPAESYAAVHARLGLQYAQVGFSTPLPYAAYSFDVVLAGGTLEHVANDGHALDELWRVLRPGGRLVITHLPNAGSLSEWLARWRWPAHAHARRYRLSSMQARLLQHGFMPLRGGWHQVLPVAPPDPAARPGLARLFNGLQPLNRVLERLWPVNRLSATLWIVAEKRLGF
ncbi:class I SAM-dependent methyltransferase [Pseudofulvimonas gallinarii]|jgi:SAM-dependent methyltransferase|uniref:Ubiquinone/menaquinone biosynthesis C-methylase UbiE n=1 Tax=Pseudofulvimonas gallinarii TaxID=634155 RepID=A0A4S3KX31_9GAMM|nr:class I SAM-dependent methyltransferase [Pseudofulvimonas gallinarii]TCS98463.1 ubiquinone/menaquinone biosynthesis C-methylase UbiE [Pseudofulvimonas gallinarii]THD13736.1 hypothetical protein B1808_06810 [Pseudofulvimonas gallinarii]